MKKEILMKIKSKWIFRKYCWNFNSKKNILGMMPHPERMVDEIISNKDGINLFSSLLKLNENY